MRYRKQTAIKDREIKYGAVRDLKMLDEENGVFEGYLAVFSNVDEDNDEIQPGAFKKTLSEHEQKRRATKNPYLMPLLWNHIENEPIGGILDAREDEHGLYVKCQLDLNVQRGREVRSGLKMGYIGTMSIGYGVVKRSYKGGVRILQELMLWEGSVVTFPANPLAMIDRGSVKSASGSADWPIGSRTAAWNNGAATKRIEAWANGDAAKLASVFFWKDPDGDPKTISAYKLLFCDVSGGKVVAMPRAIFACAGSHGIDSAKIPAGDLAGVKAKIAAYYTRMAKQFDDDSIVPPWNAKGKSMSKNKKPQVKAVDFAGALSRQTEDLQEQWADTWRAFVYSVASQMWDSGVTDKQDAVATVLEDFGKELDALVEKSQAASFFPMLDDDGDSFADPDDDDDCYDTMSMRAGFGRKAGRAMSAANVDRMTKALDLIDQGHKDLRDMVSQANSVGHDDDDPGEQNPDAPGAGNKSRKPGAGDNATPNGDDADLAAFRTYMKSLKLSA